MINGDIGYDPQKDVCAVEQTGVVDLVAAFNEHMVPSQVGVSELSEEPCEDTECLFSRAEDIFDTMQQSYTVRQNLDNKSKSVETQ